MVGDIVITKASIFFLTSLTEVAYRRMDHLRVATQPLFQNVDTCEAIGENWKLKIKRKVLHLASFWKREFLNQEMAYSPHN